MSSTSVPLEQISSSIENKSRTVNASSGLPGSSHDAGKGKHLYVEWVVIGSLPFSYFFLLLGALCLISAPAHITLLAWFFCFLFYFYWETGNSGSI